MPVPPYVHDGCQWPMPVVLASGTVLRFREFSRETWENASHFVDQLLKIEPLAPEYDVRSDWVEKAEYIDVIKAYNAT